MMTNNNPITPNSLADWHPPAGFVPVSSALPGIEVYAPAPKQVEPERRTFKCPRCGATTSYSAAEAALACAHCGYTERPDVPVVGHRAAQAEFKVETLEQATRGWGQERREIHCQSCGANLSLDPGELATTCSFCASNHVVARNETRADMLRPSHLVPFVVDPDTSVRLLRDWLARGWMYPPALRQVARSARLRGVYLPFWTFSARLDTAWRAEVGRKRTRTTWDGKRKTEIQWKWKSGRLNVRVDDALIPGSSKASRTLISQLYPFQLSALSVYDATYLAGWLAQAYDVGLRPAWDEARNWMRERAKKMARYAIHSEHVRNLGVTIDMEEEQWRYVLLPVYLIAYRFRGKVYQVMVNGQTGKVAGQKPVAWSRVLGAMALLLLPGFLLILLAGLLPQDAGGLGMLIGWCALLAGLAVVVRVLREALAAEGG